MPVPLGLPLGLAAGATLAWLEASARASREDGAAARSAAYLGGLVLGPSALYLELVGGAWANLYAYEMPSAFDLLLVVAVAVAPPGGVLAARRGRLRDDPRWALALAAASAIVTVGGAVAASGRIAVVASHAAFHRDLGGDALVESHVGAALLGALVAIAVGLALAVRAVAPPRLTSRPPSHTLRS